MKIAILSRGPDLYSTQRLKEAAEQRGHEVDVIDTLRCYMNITSGKPSIHYQGKDLPHYDAIIPRIGASITFYGAAVVRQFEMMGVFTLNPSLGITRSRDKLRALQLLSRKGIGLPITGFARSASDIDDLINTIGSMPIVVKLLEGTQGIGVVLAETKKAAQSMVQAFLGLNANIMLQEYIRESNGADIRCLIVGNKVVAAMKRQAAPGEFRSNLHQGGTAELIKISKEERDTAIKAAKIMNLRVAGVDMLRSARGPLIMEVNSSPGIRGIETTTKQDVANKIIEYIENHSKPILKHSRYEG